MSADSLYELLRRCHRSELVDLADLLRVRHTDLGLADLAARLASVVRQRGGHDVFNVIKRSGKGPPYEEIVERLARKSDVPVGATVEQTELALLTDWIRRSWDELSDAQRETAWQQLGLERPAPDADAAIAQAQEGGRAGYALSVIGQYAAPAAILVLSPIGPLAGCAALFYVARPKDHLLMPAVLEVARLRQLARHRITVGVVGSPSSGKDAAIDAIFGIETGNVNPVAGSTKEVAILRLPGPAPLYAVNTPGLGDVVEEVTEHARQVLELVDVFVYVVNAQGGVQQREKSDYDACVARGRPVLAVVNKIDTLKESDRARYLSDARDKLGAPESDFLAVAFDPLPQLSAQPIGVDEVRAWLTQALVDLGKDPADVTTALSGEPSPEA